MIKRNSLFIMIALCLSAYFAKAQVGNKSSMGEVEYEVFTPIDATTQELLNEVITRFHSCLCSQEGLPLDGEIVDHEDEITFSLRQGPYPKEEDGYRRRIVKENDFVYFSTYSSDYYHFQQSDKQYFLPPEKQSDVTS